MRKNGRKGRRRGSSSDTRGGSWRIQTFSFPRALPLGVLRVFLRWGAQGGLLFCWVLHHLHKDTLHSQNKMNTIFDHTEHKNT